MKILFLLFVILPIAEIMVLVEVGSQIGTLNTAMLVVLTALIGSLMLRHQGLSTLLRARERIDGGALPLQEMLEGICLAVGGALLVTPGFITDFIGFACLMPVSRQGLIKIVAAQVKASPNFRMHTSMHRSNFETGETFEGEFETEEKDSKRIK